MPKDKLGFDGPYEQGKNYVTDNWGPHDYYGNYGGGGYYKGTEWDGDVPNDGINTGVMGPLDAIFKEHDEAYDAAERRPNSTHAEIAAAKIQADIRLVERLNKYIKNESRIKKEHPAHISFAEKARDYFQSAIDQFYGKNEETSVECFPGHTLIATASGPRPISEIAVGDYVWAYDGDADNGRDKPVLKRVTNLYRNNTDEWIKLNGIKDALDPKAANRVLEKIGAVSIGGGYVV